MTITTAPTNQTMLFITFSFRCCERNGMTVKRFRNCSSGTKPFEAS